MVDGHSIWQFQNDGKESYPKAARLPANPREEISDRAFHAAPLLRHEEVAMGIQHVGCTAWQSCQQLQIVKLPPSVVSLAEGTFQGTDDSNVLAPGAQLDKYAFESCLTLATITFDMDKTDKPRALPEGAFLWRRH